MSRNYSSISEPKTLSADIDNAATQMTLNNVTGLPSPPYVLVISPDTASEEVVLVTTDQTGVTAPTVKISRAIETGASAVPHTNGVEVRHMIVGTDLQIAHDHIDNTTTAHNLNLKAPLASPTFTGNVVLPSTTSIGSVSATELSYVDGVTSAIQTQLNTLTTNISTAVPAGVITQFGGSTAPTGWVLCDGTAYSRTVTYNNLFTAIGTAYGVGDNSTTFNVPNLKGRVPVGLDSTQTEFDTRGETGGAKTVTLTEAQMPGHTHAYGFGGGTTGGAYITQASPSGTFANSTTAGSGEAHPNLQPYIVVNYIIKF